MRARELCAPGLPPLVRGALNLRDRLDSHTGPTPAGAGSTTTCGTNANVERAYPRWCGEHGLEQRIHQALRGLPPLVRGAHRRRRPHPVRRGPTPAGAGSTSTSTDRRACPWAYPRWCGEHQVLLVCRSYAAGLPPLVRGALLSQCQPLEADGPTPAGAGSTCRHWLTAFTSAAYPRWCGEHVLVGWVAVGHAGLPPLVRGAQRSGSEEAADLGPTPAGAGSTKQIVGAGPPK